MNRQILAKRRLETTITADPRIASIAKAVYLSLYSDTDGIEVTVKKNANGDTLVTVDTQKEEWQDYPDVVITHRDPSTVREKIPDGY